MTDPYAPKAKWTPEGLVPVTADDPDAVPAPQPGDSLTAHVDPAGTVTVQPGMSTAEVADLLGISPAATGPAAGDFYEEDEDPSPLARMFEPPAPLPLRDDRKELWVQAGVDLSLARDALEALTKPEVAELVKAAHAERTELAAGPPAGEGEQPE